MADDRRQSAALTFWERADLLPATMSMLGAFIYNVITGAFRGKGGAKTYKMHVAHAALRATVDRLSPRQMSAMNVATAKTYEQYMLKEGLKPETVELAHGASGLWIGDPTAKYVVVYYHGGGFNFTANANHFVFYHKLVKDLKASGHDVAVFLLAYSVTPEAVYPTQLRQAVEALRYILTSTSRSPSNVIIGGDSAGGNLAMAVLLHLAHPHPEIEKLSIGAPLAGVFAWAPWVDFRTDTPSFEKNRYKDIVTPAGAKKWSAVYLDGKPGDSWSEPCLAPAEWWKDTKEKTQRILIVVGGDEVLLSNVESFAQKLKDAVPETTYIVGYEETHVSSVYSAMVLDGETQQERELKRWLSARL